MKKLASLLLALVMIMSCFSAMAATVTVETGVSGHTFTAYQIFTGSQGESEGALGDVEWGNGINHADFLAALKADETTKDIFATCGTAAQVALALSEYEDNSAVAEKFAQLAYNNKSATGTPLTDGENTLADGYYLIVDTTAGEVDAYNAALLQVTRDIEIKTKMEVPELDKVIVDGEDVVTNEASIGDKVTYKLTSKVPDMTYYEKYYFIVHDTLSAGLTFNNDVVITLGDETLTPNEDYTVTHNNGQIEIVFKNFIQYKNQKDAAIVITYTATLNEKAAIVPAPNPNTANLEYSNNPNVSGDGQPDNPDKPGDDEPTGETPVETVNTYTTELTITKKDGNNNILTGAEFTLTGNGVNVVVVTAEGFVEDAEGTYYKLTDGTYTTTAPTAETAASYESTTTKYKKGTVVTVEGVGQNETKVKGFVDANGIIKFTGLGAGTYTISETVTPAGYNTAADITFTLTFDPATHTFSSDNANVIVGSGTDNTFYTTVINNAGSTLPETGGMGTTILYVGGGILVLVAIVLLIAKRRTAA